MSKGEKTAPVVVHGRWPTTARAHITEDVLAGGAAALAEFTVYERSRMFKRLPFSSFSKFFVNASSTKPQERPIPVRVLVNGVDFGGPSVFVPAGVDPVTYVMGIIRGAVKGDFEAGTFDGDAVDIKVNHTPMAPQGPCSLTSVVVEDTTMMCFGVPLVCAPRDAPKPTSKKDATKSSHPLPTEKFVSDAIGITTVPHMRGTVSSERALFDAEMDIVGAPHGGGGHGHGHGHGHGGGALHGGRISPILPRLPITVPVPVPLVAPPVVDPYYEYAYPPVVAPVRSPFAPLLRVGTPPLAPYSRPMGGHVRVPVHGGGSLVPARSWHGPHHQRKGSGHRVVLAAPYDTTNGTVDSNEDEMDDDVERYRNGKTTNDDENEDTTAVPDAIDITTNEQPSWSSGIPNDIPRSWKDHALQSANDGTQVASTNNINSNTATRERIPLEMLTLGNPHDSREDVCVGTRFADAILSIAEYNKMLVPHALYLLPSDSVARTKMRPPPHLAKYYPKKVVEYGDYWYELGKRQETLNAFETLLQTHTFEVGNVYHDHDKFWITLKSGEVILATNRSTKSPRRVTISLVGHDIVFTEDDPKNTVYKVLVECVKTRKDGLMVFPMQSPFMRR